MPINQPPFPTRVDDLVEHVGEYIDAKALPGFNLRDTVAPLADVDPTGVTECSAAILARLAYAKANGYGTVYDSGGTYLINQPIVIPYGLNFEGTGGHYDEGSGASPLMRTTFKLATGANCSMVKNDPAAPIRPGQDSLHRWQHSRITGLTLDGNRFGQTNANAHGFEFTKAWSIELENTHVGQVAGDGYHVDDCNTMFWRDINACSVGGSSYWELDSADIQIIGGAVGGSHDACVKVVNGFLSEYDLIAFNSNLFYGALTVGIDASQTTNISFTNTNGIGIPTWGGKIIIGTERISFTGRTLAGSTYTLTGVVRGVDSTTPATHSISDRVQEYEATPYGWFIGGATNCCTFRGRADQNYGVGYLDEGGCYNNIVNIETTSCGWDNANAQPLFYFDGDDSLRMGVASKSFTANANQNAAVRFGPNSSGNISTVAIDDAFSSAERVVWDGSSKPLNMVIDNVTKSFHFFGMLLGTLSNSKPGLLFDATNTTRFYFDTLISRASIILENGDLHIGSVGKGLFVKEGSNAKSGISTLVAGTVVVSTTAVTATSRIQLTSNVDGGTPGFLRVSARTAGTSFTITSSNGADTSQVAWFIVEAV